MARREVRKKMSGRNFALTIIIGVFVAIMVSTLFNLIVSYAYEPPKYDDYCKGIGGAGPYPVKYGLDNAQCGNCTFSKTLQEQTENCNLNNGISVYDYDDRGCTSTLKECNMCNKNFEDIMNLYNRNTFFVFALIGFALIVAGLFI